MGGKGEKRVAGRKGMEREIEQETRKKDNMDERENVRKEEGWRKGRQRKGGDEG